MAPKVIDHDVIKFREELSNDVIEKLLIDGGAEKVKESVTNWGYSIENEIVAVPIMIVGQEGKLTGAKWQVVGGIKPKAVKAQQIWPEAEKDIFVEMKIEDLSIFNFHNKCRNVSSWLDSDTLTWSVYKQKNKNKTLVPVEEHQAAGIQKFCLRIGILPISGDTASLTLAFVPFSKEELKKCLPDSYSKTYCPQVALTLGSNNTRAVAIKFGIQEAIGSKTGLKVLPLLEDMRVEVEKTNPVSMDIRKGLAKFLRTCQGFNNRVPKSLTDAIEEVKRNPSPAEPEWVWPEPHDEESVEPLEEPGWLNLYILTMKAIEMDLGQFEF